MTRIGVTTSGSMLAFAYPLADFVPGDRAVGAPDSLAQRAHAFHQGRDLFRRPRLSRFSLGRGDAGDDAARAGDDGLLAAFGAVDQFGKAAAGIEHAQVAVMANILSRNLYRP